MALSESRFRQIIKEEARRALREGAGKTVSASSLVMSLADAGEKELSQKVDDYNRRNGGNIGIEFDVRDDRVALYVNDGGRTGNYMFDIPLDVYKELKSGLTDKLSERRRALREARDPRLDSEDIDQPAHMLISGLTASGVEDVYPEAGALRKELQRLQRDFDQGMAIIRPSKSGGQDKFDVFLTYTSSKPINDVPIPRRVFGLAGISLDTQGQLSSAGARMRGISGFGESRRRGPAAKLSESRIEQIVLEETRRARRALREGDDDMGDEVGEPDAYLTIFNISMLADAMDMGVEDFDLMVQDVAEQRMPGRIQFVGGDSGGHGPDPEPYSEEDDSYTVMGNKRDLERLVSALEGEIQGPAQSIEDGEGLDYQISEF